MKIRVRLFAVARELAGAELVAVEATGPCTIAELRRELARQVPALAAVLPHVLFAVGSEYARDDALVPVDAEVACIPPVSGG